MKRWWLVVMFVQSFALAYTAEDCRKLAESLTVSLPDGVPDFLKAGDKAKLEVKITVADKKLLEPFKQVPVSLSITNGLYGSNGLYKFLSIKRENEKGAPILKEDFEINWDISPAMSGYYSLKFNFTFFDDDGVCRGVIKTQPNARLVVLNDPLKADLEPPIVTDVKFEKNDLALDGSLTVRLKLSDKSAICTADLKAAKKCESVAHVAFLNLDTKKELGDYDSGLTYDAGTKEYLLKISLPAKSDKGGKLFVKGKYQLLGINISDIAGNAVHELQPGLRKEFTIR